MPVFYISFLTQTPFKQHTNHTPELDQTNYFRSLYGLCHAALPCVFLHPAAHTLLSSDPCVRCMASPSMDCTHFTHWSLRFVVWLHFTARCVIWLILKLLSWIILQAADSHSSLTRLRGSGDTVVLFHSPRMAQPTWTYGPNIILLSLPDQSLGTALLDGVPLYISKCQSEWHLQWILAYVSSWLQPKRYLLCKFHLSKSSCGIKGTGVIGCVTWVFRCRARSLNNSKFEEKGSNHTVNLWVCRCNIFQWGKYPWGRLLTFFLYHQFVTKHSVLLTLLKTAAATETHSTKGSEAQCTSVQL